TSNERHLRQLLQNANYHEGLCRRRIEGGCCYFLQFRSFFLTQQFYGVQFGTIARIPRKESVGILVSVRLILPDAPPRLVDLRASPFDPLQEALFSSRIGWLNA